MRIVIYARKSTESEERQVQSLDDQINALSQLAEREGLIVSEVFQESKSAKLPNNRPEFSRLMELVQSGSIQGILTWSINRLSRNALDGGQVSYLLQSGKLDFIRTIERTYRPEDNALLLSIENGMAIAYLQDLSRNVTRGMKGKVERGWCPYKAPIGYRNDAESREVVIDQERWGLVRRGWDLAMEGKNLGEIHRFFHSHGLTLRSKRGQRQPLSRTAVHSLFSNPFYKGLIPYKGQLFPGAHEPMVTAGEFEKAREQLCRRNKNTKPLNRLFPFSGLLTCAKCGSAVVGEEKKKRLSSGKVKMYTYYHCSGSKGCQRNSIREEELHRQATELVGSVAISRHLAQWIQDAVISLAEAELPDKARTASEIEKEVIRLENQLKRLTTLRLDAEISSTEFAQMRLELVSRVDKLREAKHKELDRAAQLLRAFMPRLEAAIAANEITGNTNDPRVIAQVLRKGGEYRLHASGSSFTPDPVLQIIASFEPLRDSSEKPKRGDFVPANSVWWAFARNLHTALYGLEAPRKIVDAPHALVKGPLHQMVGIGGSSVSDSFSWR